mmetsp:Transcript_22233/g.29054  ORF Transcript_22233/g.29054 Transcript_22233/m.29054 type:complete len:277 (+) Transcript_22233:78-908(+)
MGNACMMSVSATYLRKRYLLSSNQQGLALKTYIETLKIPLKYVDRVYDIANKAQLQGYFVQKKEFLILIDMDPTPFAMGALNTLNSDPELEFFEFFCAFHHYCCFNRQELISHTFNLVDPTGKGRLNVDELALLVHYVYGDYVAKAESGEKLIHTTTSTHIETANLVMKHMDSSGRGHITLEEFSNGLRLHTNLLQPVFQAQRTLRTQLGGSHFWENEEHRVHVRCLKQHQTMINIFHDCLRIVKDPKKNRGSFSEKGVAGQGGISHVNFFLLQSF